MDEEKDLIYEKLSNSFRSRKFSALRIILLDMEPFDIAEFMEEQLEDKEKLTFFRLLPKELASDVFVEIDSDTQEYLIKSFTDKELKAVVDDMFLDDTVDIIEEMPANVVKRILINSSPENRKQINELLEYPEDSAGSIMTPEFISLSATMTVEMAFDKIRKTGLNKESIYTCYVTDRKKHLIGVCTAKDLLIAEKTQIIEEIMNSSVQTVDTLTDKEEVALKLSQYDYLALPVIDKEGCLVGIVTVDDAVDVIQEEATEDIQKMAAISPTEQTYLKQSVWSTWLARAPWLIILLVASTFTSLILSSFEVELNNISPVLYAFIPMLMGTAGNAGGQTSAIIIRSLALNEVEPKDILKVILKELLSSLVLGLTMAVVTFAKLMLLDRLYDNSITWQISAVISLVVFASILMSKLVGCLLPIIAKKIKLDPAVIANPFMTTIVDALSVLIYCGIAIAIIPLI